MSAIEVGRGSRQGRMHFYVRSPMKHPSLLPDSGVEFSRETPIQDWGLFSYEGFGMISRLLPFLMRGDYIQIHRWYIEITFVSGERWPKVFPEVCAILNEWQGGGRLRLEITQSCPASKRPWIERLVRLVAES